MKLLDLRLMTVVAFSGLFSACSQVAQSNELIPASLTSASSSYVISSSNKDSVVSDSFIMDSVIGEEMFVSSSSSMQMTPELLSIQGEVVLREQQLLDFALKRNPEMNPQMVPLFLTLSKTYGVRGDLAFLQSCLETNFYQFGGLVKESQNNFGGLGATGPGYPGLSFPTIEMGVLANIQHLYAYASMAPIPAEEVRVDPRFIYVKRGSAKTFFELSGKWASDPQYGTKIASLFDLAQQY